MSATLAERLDAIPVPGPAEPDTAKLRALIAERAQDRHDEALLLDALDLLDPGRRLRSSRGDRASFGSKVVHGSGPGAVDQHEELGEELCGPCRRWVDVQARKNGRQAEQPEASRCGDVEDARTRHARHTATLAPCGTPSAKRRHRRHGEDCAHCWPDRERAAA